MNATQGTGDDRPAALQRHVTAAGTGTMSLGIWQQRASQHTYIVLSLLTRARTEELRALEWQHVHLEWVDDVPPHVEVWRSVREGGDTKTLEASADPCAARAVH
jgi:hypothetical protein